jgi:hypothetical protein
MRNCRPAQEKGRVQVYVERTEPHVVGGFQDIAPRDDPGIVDQDIDAAKFVDCVRYKSFTVGFLA